MRKTSIHFYPPSYVGNNVTTEQGFFGIQIPSNLRGKICYVVP